MKLRLSLLVFLSTTIMNLSAQPKFGQNSIGIFENHGDIGEVKHKGFVNFDPIDQSYLIGASGSNMWFGSDEFHYAWSSIQGDFIARAEFEFIGTGVDPHRKMGWTVRNNLSTGSPMVHAVVHGDGLTDLQYRPTQHAETEQITMHSNGVNVIQLERRGNTYIMSAGHHGDTLQSVQLDLDLKNEVYIGLALCSHNPDVIERAIVKNVRIIKPVAPDYTPYQDYIGSHLEVMDIDTKTRRILMSSKHSIQAPNWTTDGKQLIYNSNGYLYYYNLHDGSVSQMNTGFADQNNNDHVLSFDGSQMAISHYVTEEGRASTIYVLPTSGSDQPQRITKPNVGHSFLHGWSTDHQYIVFTGQRDDQWNIFKVNVKTGEEIQLTHEPTLDDGPEYSPDGEYIYFNSTRSGMMKIWRMKDDGSEQEQITFDDQYNDWFAHPSPDGKWIVLLSYHTDVEPDQHPFYQHCVLRMMPASGGTPEIIAYIYGGQGSINVPSWSPDSKRIAFVTNSDF